MGRPPCPVRGKPRSATWARSWAPRAASSPSTSAWRPICAARIGPSWPTWPRPTRRACERTPEVLADPAKYFDELVEIDLSALEPQVVGPHTPDLVREVSALGEEATSKGWPLELKACLIGSCTNSSYEDLSRAASVVRQALGAGLRVEGAPLRLARLRASLPDRKARRHTRRIHRGRGNRPRQRLRPLYRPVAAHRLGPGRPDSILSSFNRNFPGATTGDGDR